MKPILHQFEFSHFNEKARWALDFKGIDHTRQSYLPGPHMPAIKKISGQTATPVLQVDDQYIAGSAAIIDHLEARWPSPALYPAGDEDRAAALKIQAEFDKTVGPAVRTALFSALVHEGSYLTAMFAGKKSFAKRLAYRATFPLARGLIAKGNGVTKPGNVERCIEVTHATLDRVADAVAADGYFVGGSFSVADLTAAALLAPIAKVAHVDMKRPEPIPARVLALLTQFEAHAAIRWVNEIYNRHR